MILEDVEYIGALPDIPSESKAGIDLRYADKSIRVVKCRVKCLRGQVCLFLDTENENVATACLVLDEVKKDEKS